VFDSTNLLGNCANVGETLAESDKDFPCSTTQSGSRTVERSITNAEYDNVTMETGQARFT